VAAVVLGVGGTAEYVPERVRRRFRCSDRACPGGSGTQYTDGDYPHRTFQLDVVVSAVLRGEGGSRSAAARDHLCSRRSVGRWTSWCAGMAAPEELGRVVVRVDPDGLPAEAATPREGLAGRCVRLWERLAGVLCARGVILPSGRCGMQRLLCWQHHRHGLIAWLTRSSPLLPVESWSALM
jgi:hypothetical protein